MNYHEFHSEVPPQERITIKPHPWGWYVLLDGSNIARHQSREAAEGFRARLVVQLEEYEAVIRKEL